MVVDFEFYVAEFFSACVCIIQLSVLTLCYLYAVAANHPCSLFTLVQQTLFVIIFSVIL